jgi:hypothetical protein
LQGAQPLGLQMLHQELVLTARFVNVDPSARQYGEPVLRLDLPVTVGRAEGHRLHLRFAVLQREVVVAARRKLEARDLTGYRNIRELPVQNPADRAVEFADAEDTALRKEVEAEIELLHLRIVARYFFTERITPSGEETPETVAFSA